MIIIVHAKICVLNQRQNIFQTFLAVLSVVGVYTLVPCAPRVDEVIVLHVESIQRSWCAFQCEHCREYTIIHFLMATCIHPSSSSFHYKLTLLLTL